MTYIPSTGQSQSVPPFRKLYLPFFDVGIESKNRKLVRHSCWDFAHPDVRLSCLCVRVWKRWFKKCAQLNTDLAVMQIIVWRNLGTESHVFYHAIIRTLSCWEKEEVSCVMMIIILIITWHALRNPQCYSDVNKDWACKDKDKDKDQAYKVQDKDND